jgi:hypothetical protein
VRPLREAIVAPCHDCGRNLEEIRPKIDDFGRLRFAILEADEGRAQHLEDL